MEDLRAFIVANPILAASLSSLWGAIVIDLVSFSKTKEPGAFWQQFSVSAAIWKYLQALVAGFVGNATLAAGASVVTVIVVYFW